MTLSRKQIIILSVLGAIIIAIAIIAGVWLSSHTKISIVNENDKSLTFELEDKKYQISPSDTKSLWLTNGAYTYRTTIENDGNNMSIVDEFNTENTSNLTFNYSIFEKDSIKDFLCDELFESSDCTISSNSFTATFVEDYNWAVIDGNLTSTEPQWTILKLENGTWDIKYRPQAKNNAGNIAQLGTFPFSVGEVINEDQ